MTKIHSLNSSSSTHRYSSCVDNPNSEGMRTVSQQKLSQHPLVENRMHDIISACPPKGPGESISLQNLRAIFEMRIHINAHGWIKFSCHNIVIQ